MKNPAGFAKLQLEFESFSWILALTARIDLFYKLREMGSPIFEASKGAPIVPGRRVD